MFYMTKVVHVVIGTFLFLASGIATAAIITLTPLTSTTVAPGLDIQFSLSADFDSDTTGGGAVDISFDSQVVQFEGFVFETGLDRDTGFDLIDLQSDTLLSIGLASRTSIINPGEFDFTAAFNIGVLTLKSVDPGNTQINLVDSLRWGSFSTISVPVTYSGSSVQVVQAVPIPAAFWLMFSSLVFLTRFSRQKS